MFWVSTPCILHILFSLVNWYVLRVFIYCSNYGLLKRFELTTFQEVVK